jgi:stage V sporulation protein D (sporulation-specific penicillin-binding protein)
VEYRIGGKTGTAQKLGTGGVVGSFACFGPLENPRLAALVICDNPTKGNTHGSIVAAPFAVDMLRQSLRYTQRAEVRRRPRQPPSSRRPRSAR